MRLSIAFVALLLISSCGGGGGGGGSTPTTPSVPAPSVNFSADPTSVLIGSDSTLTWSSTNATSCSASGAWSGARATSGSETVTISAVGNISFTITCSGEGGNRSATATIEGYRQTDGVVVDGYISGADVFIDENANFIADATENATTSDNEGKFTIKYADGSLISLGGTDLDSQTLLDNLLITHKITGHSDFKAITPVTSVAAFMQDASSVNKALGIDAAIDVFTFDPVANKGDGGINDYLYEKGNQLTILAFALQNIVNDLNAASETTQDYFKAIAEEIDTEFANTSVKVDIETATFVTNVMNNILTAKSITMDEAIKANTITALAGVLPIIQVQSTDDLTTAVIRFSLSTLQTDIVGVANGTASEELIASYTSDILNYIAEDQNIDSNEITPDITAIADEATVEEDGSVTINVIANDSYTTTAPIGVSASNGTNGLTTLAESSPEQVVYTPNADFNGTDTFTYSITQGDKTSSAEVTVTVSAVNDAPSIDIASTIQVPENQTAVTTVSVSDVDEDDLTLSLGGTDAASFDLSNENVLTFKEEPDYETKTSYGISLSVTDGTETVTKDVTIVITNVNDVAPEFTSEATFSATENQTAIDTVTATDAEGDDITFTVSGSELAITSAGVLAFVSAPDYETKTTYTATVTASDGINSTTQNITVNVTNVNDVAPVFTSDATFSAAENQTAIGTVIATDAEGDTITFDVSGSELTITSTGTLTFVSAPNYESKSSYSAIVTASDGVNSTAQSLQVNITDENDAPRLLTDTELFIDEGQVNIISLQAQDDDGDDVVIALTEQADYAHFNLESFSWNLSFKEDSVPDYETKNIYSLIVKLNDQNEGVTNEEVTININDVNESPTLWCQENLNEYTNGRVSCFTYLETSTDGIQLNFRDPENDDVTFNISGQDSQYFNLDKSTNLLTFTEQPDYESKRWYYLDIQLDDGENITSYQRVPIQIINVNDEDSYLLRDYLLSNGSNREIGYIPIMNGDGSNYYGTDPSGYDFAIDDSLGTTDGNLFEVDEFGLLKFKNDPSSLGSLKDEYNLTLSALLGEDLYKFIFKVKIKDSSYYTRGNELAIENNSSYSSISKDGTLYNNSSQLSVYKYDAGVWSAIDLPPWPEDRYIAYGRPMKGNTIYSTGANTGQENILRHFEWGGDNFTERSIALDHNSFGEYSNVDISYDDSTIAFLRPRISTEPWEIDVFEKSDALELGLAPKGEKITFQSPYEDEELSTLMEKGCSFAGGELTQVELSNDGDILATLTSCTWSEAGYYEYQGDYIFFYDYIDGTWTQRDTFIRTDIGSFVPERDINKIRFNSDGTKLFAYSGRLNSQYPARVQSNHLAHIWVWDGSSWIYDEEIPIHGYGYINNDFTSIISTDSRAITFYKKIDNSWTVDGYLDYGSQKIKLDRSFDGSYLIIEKILPNDGSSNTVTILDLKDPEPESDRPVISNFSVSPDAIDVSSSEQSITLSIKITDESGLKSTGLPHVQLGTGNNFQGSWTLISGDNKDGVYESVITVPTTAAPGSYDLFSGFIVDVWGNTISNSVGGGLTVTNSNTESNRPEIFDLSVTPNEINVSAQDQDVTLSIRITDESGLKSTGLPHVQLGTGNNFQGSWTLISGDNKDGVYESVITVPTTAAPGDYRVFSGFITDEWGNTSSFSIGAGDEGGLTVVND